MHHFKMFWCISFVHIPDVHGKKLGVKSIKCVLLGGSEESKAYKLYDHVNNKILINENVVFEESKGLEWNRNDKDEKSKSTSNINGEEVDIENDEVEVIDDGVHVENDEYHHDLSNVESASKDNVTEEESNAQRQEHSEPAVWQRRRPEYLDDYVTNS